MKDNKNELVKRDKRDENNLNIMLFCQCNCKYELNWLRVYEYCRFTSKFVTFIVDFDMQFTSGIKHEVGEEVDDEEGYTKDHHEWDDVPVKFSIPTKEYTARDVVQCSNCNEDTFRRKQNLPGCKSDSSPN